MVDMNYDEINHWDYFRIVNSAERKAQCLICQGVYSYLTTSTNLKCHVRRKHPDALLNVDFTSLTSVSSIGSFIRHFFIKMPGENHLVKCKLCRCQWNRRTSSLMKHMKKDHYTAYFEYFADNMKGNDNDETVSVEDRLNDAVDDPEDNKLKFSSEIWRHFEHEDDFAKCTICKESAGNSIEDMKNHLEEHHSTVLDEIIAKAQKDLHGESDDDNDLEDDNIYTEVVYLEDESRPKNTSQKKRKKIQVYQQKSKKKPKPERKTSESSEEYIKPKKDNVPDELEIFINYVRCLLKKVPQQTSAKLHFDIINLIIRAQNDVVAEHVNLDNVTSNVNISSNLNTTLDQPSIIFTETGPGTSGNTQRVITVPLQNIITQNNQRIITIPQLYSVSSSNTTNTSPNTVATRIGETSTTLSMPSLTKII